MTLYIGLNSGTSMDAVDAALVDIDDESRCHIRHYREIPYPPTLASRLHAARRNAARLTLPELYQLDVEVGRAFATAAVQLLSAEKLDAGNVAAIGSHGQTLYHQPRGDTPYSVQIGDLNTIAARTGIATIGDFRRMDMALGGQGAPLAPLFHAAVFRHESRGRAIVNIGGIANVTILRANSSNIIGFDSGPGNALMDEWAREHIGQAYDKDGQWAANGRINDALLQALLADDYFKLRPPKSTGREYFNREWLQVHLANLPIVPNANDVQTTLLQLAACSIAAALAPDASVAEIYVCGGGAKNAALMQALRTALPAKKVSTTAELGVAPEAVEAVLFAWLARQRQIGLPVSLGSITGASGPAILGGVYLPPP
ncbi:MAG: anhydro-N-acetylmuramic acid kinase [Gammaproteobacteria bacterium]